MELRRAGMIVVCAAVLATACAGGAADDLGGAVELALVAPATVSCVRLSFAVPGRTVERDVVPNGGAALRLDGLPVGDVQLAGAAFAQACGAGEPLWRSPPAVVKIWAGRATVVTMTFHPNGIADVTSSFVQDTDGGLPPGVQGTSFPAKLSGCRLVTLDAEKRYAPDSFLDGVHALDPIAGFTLPNALEVVEGNAGDGSVTLSYRDAQGALRICRYVAEASVPAPQPSGARYLFDSCDSGAAAGAAVTASSLSLHVDDGASLSPAGRTLVRAELAEAQPCTGRPMVSLFPSLRDRHLADFAGADGTIIRAFGPRDPAGEPLDVDLLTAVSPTGEQVAAQLTKGALTRIWSNGGVTLSFTRTITGVKVRVQQPGAAPIEALVPTLNGPFGAPAALESAGPDPNLGEKTSALTGPSGVSLVQVSACGDTVEDALVEMEVMTRQGVVVMVPGTWTSPGTYQVELPLQSDLGDRADALCQDAFTALGIGCTALTTGGESTAALWCSVIAAATTIGSPGVFTACLGGVTAAIAMCESIEGQGAEEALEDLVCEDVRGAIDALTDVYPIAVVPRVRVPGSPRLFFPGDPRFVPIPTPAGPFPDFTVDASEACRSPLPTCDLQVAPSVISVPSRGGVQAARVVVPFGCDWTVTTDVPWIDVGTPSGSGTGPITFAVDANSGSRTRFGHLSIGTATVVITQGGASGCAFDVSPQAFSFAAVGGNGEIGVTATDSACAWTVRSDAAWLRVNGASQTGTGVVGINALPNPGGAGRVAHVLVAGSTLVVTQEGSGGAPPPPPTPGGCQVTLTPASATFGEGGGLGSFAVHAPDGCAWQATTNDSFLFIGHGAGVGDGTVDYSVDFAFDSGRTGHIQVGGASFTVAQTFQSITCAWGLDHLSHHFPANGGSDSVKVYTNFALCPYQARSDNPDWIEVNTVGARGVGQGTVTYSLRRNTSTTPRQGTITFMNVIFHVDQDGQEPCTFSVSPTSLQAPASGGSDLVTVGASRPDCAWNITVHDPEWVSITGSTARAGSGTVAVSVKQNLTPSVRTFSLNVAGTAVSIAQPGNGPASRQLTIVTTGSGSISLPTGESCTGATCAWALPDGGSVTLTATGLAGATFQGWGDACVKAGATTTCTLVLDRDLIASAGFSAAPPPTAALTVTITGVGKVVINDATTCTSTCTQQISLSSKVNLVATPASGAQFVGWTGACAGKTTSCALLLTGAATVTAAFAGPPPPPPVVVATLLTANTGPTPLAISQGGPHTLKISIGTGMTQGSVSLQRLDGTLWTQIASPACTSSGSFTTCQSSQAVSLDASAHYRWDFRLFSLPTFSETQGGQVTLTRQ